MVAEIYRQDLLAFIHRSFLELNPAATFEYNWHQELIAQSLEDVAYGSCKRSHHQCSAAALEISSPIHRVPCLVPGALSGSRWHASLTPRIFPTLWHDSLVASWAVHLSSPVRHQDFWQKNTVADFETTQGGFRFSTSVGGGFTGRGADVIVIDDPLKADEALSDARREA
jgi:hypothetical protein